MPDAAIVTTIPDGAARSLEWRQHVWHAPGGVTGGFVERSGLSVSGMPAATNWGLSGEVPAFINYLGMYFARIRAGAQQFGPPIQWCTQKPASGGNFEWRDGFTAIEGVFAWPTDTAAKDNGIQVTTNNFTRVVTQGQGGVEVWNNNGQLTFTVQGAGRTDVALNAGVSIREPMKIRLEFRNATKNRAASVTVLVNDIQQAVANSGLPSSVTAGGLFCNIGVFDAINYCYFRDLRYVRGPDSPLGT